MDITLGMVIDIARDLKSENGENTEYDRALVEMTYYLAGLTTDDREAVGRVLGIRVKHPDAEPAYSLDDCDYRGEGGKWTGGARMGCGGRVEVVEYHTGPRIVCERCRNVR